jgi:hypothetical protein
MTPSEADRLIGDLVSDDPTRRRAAANDLAEHREVEDERLVEELIARLDVSWRR